MSGQIKQQGTVSEAEITLGVLNAVEANSRVTQRSVSQDLGIALGLANAYLKRCIKKGYVKISQAPRNRYAYYLTPKGFVEKSRLTAEYLSQSLNFFRITRQECTEILRDCAARGLTRIALAGATDLTEVAVLCAEEVEAVELCAVLVAEDIGRTDFIGLPVTVGLEHGADYQAVLVTDMAAPQATFEALSRTMPLEAILTPSYLHVSRRGLAGLARQGEAP